MTDTMKTVPILLLLCLSTLSFCTTKPGEPQGPGLPGLDTPVAETVPEAAPPLIETVIEKELLYDQHTLADTYPYKDTMREFQWDKIRSPSARFASTETVPLGDLSKLQEQERGSPAGPEVSSRCLQAGFRHFRYRTLPICPAISAGRYTDCRTLWP